jgi:hypothetical protein
MKLFKRLMNFQNVPLNIINIAFGSNTFQYQQCKLQFSYIYFMFCLACIMSYSNNKVFYFLSINEFFVLLISHSLFLVFFICFLQLSNYKAICDIYFLL